MEEISRGGPLRGEFPVYVNFRVVVGGEKQAGFLGEFVEEEFPPEKRVAVLQRLRFLENPFPALEVVLPVKDVHGLGVGKFGGSYPLPLEGVFRRVFRAGWGGRGQSDSNDDCRDFAHVKPIKIAARDVKKNERGLFSAGEISTPDCFSRRRGNFGIV